MLTVAEAVLTVAVEDSEDSAANGAGAMTAGTMAGTMAELAGTMADVASKKVAVTVTANSTNMAREAATPLKAEAPAAAECNMPRSPRWTCRIQGRPRSKGTYCISRNPKRIPY